MPKRRLVAYKRPLSLDETRIHSNFTMISSSQSRSQQSHNMKMTMCWLFVVLLVLCSKSDAFQITMQDYRPPVKSSVSKIVDSRGRSSSTSPSTSSSSSTSTTNHRRRSRSSPPSTPSSNSIRRTSFKSAYAGSSFAAPVPSSSPVATFERRMRNLVLGSPAIQHRRPQPQQRQKEAAETAATTLDRLRQPGLPSNVFVVDNLQDYKTVVGDENDKIVAVRFYATWCRACKAVAPHYYRMAVKHPNLVFVDVPVTDRNSALHQGLGVPSLPFGHIYHPSSGLVEELKLTRKDIKAFEMKLDSYREGLCHLEDEKYFMDSTDDQDHDE